ncbi:MAG TPA: FAD-binding oxidoreductase [Dehalococcoidia bacterium]|nr:FAD-binding oxidoreductase [Dehalococcoidia bacterium]
MRPENREEVATLLAAASAAGLVVVPHGARTALALGRPLEQYDVAIDLSALNRVVEYEPDDLTITVEAGFTLAALQQQLGEHGQYLSADPPPDDRVTIGGLLATARPGAWRGHAPSARDLVLGITVAQADGQLVRSGGRVVKNVSGYDLHRMHTGALGAFGVIVEASFKLAPLPAAVHTVILPCEHLEAAERLTFELWDLSLPTRTLTLLSASAASTLALAVTPHVVLELAGVASAVERATEIVSDLGESVEANDNPLRQLRSLAGGDGTVLRLTVPASSLRAAIEAAERAGCSAWGQIASGSVLARANRLAPETVRELRARAVELGGSLQVESAPMALRSAVDPFDIGERELVVALNQQFDPQRTLNRGRWSEQV